MSAFFVVLLGGSGKTSVFPEVTGVAATASVGTVSAGSEQIASVTGVSGTAALGSVLAKADIVINASGVAATGGVGNAIALSESDFLVTGVSGTAAIGSVASSGTASVLTTGVSATGDTGQMGYQQGVAVSATGVAGSGAVSGVTVREGTSVSLTGVSASGQVSGVTVNVTAFISINATGVAATGSVGAVTARTSDSFIALATASSPYVHAYEWDDASGFGVKFANPASLPVGATRGIDITTYSGTKYLAASSAAGSSGYASYIYSINGITGWGTRQNGDGNQRTGKSVKWFVDGSGNTFLATGTDVWAGVGSTANTYISKFTGSLVSPRTSLTWTDDSTGLFFDLDAVTYVGLTSTDGAIVGGFGSVAGGPPSTYMQGVSITESTMAFGTEWSPTSKPQGPVNGLASYDISRSSNPRAVVFAAHDSAPYISAWKVEASPLAFVRYSNPASALPGNAEGVAYRATSSSTGQVAVAHASSPRISAYTWTTSSGFGTKYSNPVTLPTGNGDSVRFNAAGTCVAVGHATSPYISVYPWSTASGFGTKFSNPSTPMGATVTSVAFSN